MFPTIKEPSKYLPLASFLQENHIEFDDIQPIFIKDLEDGRLFKFEFNGKCYLLTNKKGKDGRSYTRVSPPSDIIKSDEELGIKL
jgi:hypothetical protein